MIYFCIRTLLSQEGRPASNLNIPIYARLMSPGVSKHLQHLFVPKECLQLFTGLLAEPDGLLYTIMSHEGESKLFILSI
jgi:hypothetical protein